MQRNYPILDGFSSAAVFVSLALIYSIVLFKYITPIFTFTMTHVDKLFSGRWSSLLETLCLISVSMDVASLSENLVLNKRLDEYQYKTKNQSSSRMMRVISLYLC